MGASEATDLADRTPRARTAPAAVTVCYAMDGRTLFLLIYSLVKFSPNFSAVIASSLFGQPLFIPPKYFNTLFVLYPLQPNSPIILKPLFSKIVLSVAPTLNLHK